MPPTGSTGLRIRTAAWVDFDYVGERRSRMETNPDGFVVKYQYDAAGRLAGLTDGADVPIVTYTYDAAGRLDTEVRGDGSVADLATTDYQYDPAGRLLKVTNFRPDLSVETDFTYTYDELGRRATMNTIDGLWTYGYDAAGQLTAASFAPAGGSPIAAQTFVYTYDAAGNRATTTINGAPSTYTANSLNQYTSIGRDDFHLRRGR